MLTPTVARSERIDVRMANLHFYPRYSGASLRFSGYSEGLAARGVTLGVVAGRDAGQHVDGALAPTEVLQGMPVWRVPVPDGTSARRHWTFWRGLTERVLREGSSVDVLQAFSLTPASIPWLIRLRAAGIPLLFVHTVMGSKHESAIRRWRGRAYWSQGLRLFHRIVTSTTVMRDALQAQGVTTPVDVVPNGVDLCRFRPVESAHERIEFRHALGLSPEAEIVLFLGPIHPRKGPDLLVAAWRQVAARHPGAALLMVGPRHDQTDPSLRAWGASLQVAATDSVRFVGMVDDPEVYLRNADVFVFPSEREGMGNVALEAFASGLATVLVPFRGLAPEHGEPGRHYHLAERSAAALFEALDLLLSDATRRQALASQARAWAEETLDLEPVLDQYAAVYRSLAADGRT